MADQTNPDIVYTTVDEAPELASASLLPIIQAFAAPAGVSVGKKDISLAARILAAVAGAPDHLAELGGLVKTPTANVIKLPNISASQPQLDAAIAELQSQGHDIPAYPANPTTPEEERIKAAYDAVKGSAVNPVLREGNSDRRAAQAVKNYARANPHRMGEWTADSKTTVMTMGARDFCSNETSTTITAAQAGPARIEFVGADGTTVLKEGVPLDAGTVCDATFMSVAALRDFLAETISATKEAGVLWSIHLKATMMKVSDPIIFGHAVEVFFAELFEKHPELTGARGGLGTVLNGASDAVLADYQAVLDKQPPMYMVNSDTGLTNLHVPSDVIIDASLPAIIRAGGKGWGPDGNEADTVCVIPDSSYAPVYAETIEFFKKHGKLDVTTAGTVQNLGLMAQKAEEYGSHPTTFEAPADGTIRMIAANGDVLHSHEVEKGDIWRSCTAKKAPIEDWVKLAIERQKLTGYRAIFWLNADRAHDAELIKHVTPILEAAGVADKFEIMSPAEATVASLETITKGENTIAITGNVLRDYLTDLFPILELGTSAKMLSIVKLMQGGGLFETGAGGSAPKHVQQLQAENHLRWDSLGEFCALGESFKFLAQSRDNAKAGVLGDAVEAATQKVLEFDRSPGRKVGQPDNRASHYWFARYWAEALAAQDKDAEIAAHFAPIAAKLAENEETILAELAAGAGTPADTGGYYHNDPAKVAAVMRPSPTLNAIIG
ncbi:monomeric isocitrate dehydrogenase [Dinoroseobacter shibae DFL 12 = DSM 16493]|jgi:isocitrate dehydrogenase|uniref:isocitrate dehydrogenase (NADP(+)) n=1 Tax=Dinoroseobacter shibae (strain DSM 16493 / NCIMB 14021 / DFL 12) TaxID=398580 RepID=A8LP43_DINSH|nr:NADP-dependent isocitrate dehydrogenase [Dinoroseobacter shibae]ABV93725.1 monomeric isocitrate dehydrogenase [Dinoroseobacter shibae DFL 12 = DSM 16493]URF45179.1 NADP-dependent isocitrate dehydrogenase [Dinoroseobacter shibae]URF49484.1 NADP-dependent isocitrate dehydrogenase [Dinoroseobacter shibae]